MHFTFASKGQTRVPGPVREVVKNRRRPDENDRQLLHIACRMRAAKLFAVSAE